MKRSLTALALLTAALVPELALAKAVEDVRLDTDPADVVVTIVADESLEAPAVRTSPGSVRLRFYDAKETKLVHLKGDGSAVRSVDLNRGSDQSAALVINFGDRTKLAPSDVRVERDGDAITLRIARGLLPAVNGAPTMAPAAVPSAQKAPVQAVQKALPAAPAAKQTPAPAAVPAAPAATVTVRTEEVAPLAAQAAPRASTSSGTLGTKPTEQKATPAELKLNTSTSSPMPMLLAISALLGLSYVGLQFVMRKKKLAGSAIPAIDVVAQRRIGPRHQLVIVRAFDRDYLLSVQGGQTTVIARSSRQKLAHAEALLSPLPRLRAAAADSRAFEEDDEPTFGGELFKQALEQRERAREHTASTRLEQREAREVLEGRAFREPTSSTRPEQRPYREPTSSTRPEQRESREPREARLEQRGEWREPASSARLEQRESRDDRSEPRNDFREPAASARPEQRERRDPTAGMRLEAVRAEARAELELERERDRERDRDRDREFEQHDELPVPPSAVSDSVSGLLRLRKQSGR